MVLWICTIVLLHQNHCKHGKHLLFLCRVSWFPMHGIHRNRGHECVTYDLRSIAKHVYIWFIYVMCFCNILILNKICTFENVWNELECKYIDTCMSMCTWTVAVAKEISSNFCHLEVVNTIKIVHGVSYWKWLTNFGYILY